MEPVELRSERLVLSAPRSQDRPVIFEYCQDPLFERYLTVPWPYRTEDAAHFVDEVVPAGWTSELDLIWALRHPDTDEFLGVVSVRVQPEPRVYDVGYWLGAPHRGQGFMPEAVTAVVHWLLHTDRAQRVLWECAVGNLASASVARSSGFAFTTTAAGRVRMRDGSHPECWHGFFDSTAPDALSTWPAETFR